MENHLHPLEDPSAKIGTSPGDPPNVAGLTRRMVAGDDHAYRQFHHTYFDRLSRYLLVVTAGNEDAMHEAMQRTMIRIVKNIRVFSSEEMFWSWLTVLARSSVLDENRQRRRYFAFLDRFTRHEEIASASPGDGRLGELLHQHLASLPADERVLLERKYFEHRSVREIASLDQVSEKTVESRLSRVRSKLKQAVLTALRHETCA